MLTKHTMVAAAIVSLLSGCAIVPEYIRPTTSLPDKFVNQAAVEQRQAAVNAELTTWWAGFDDPLLTQFIGQALEQNLDLALASARVAQARGGLSAADAALLPSFNVGAQAARGYQSVETPLGKVLNSKPGYDRNASAYEVNVGTSWELDVFGGLKHGRNAALADYQASEAGAIATRLAVTAQTADIYITIRGLQARLDIARRQVQTEQDLLAKVNLLHRHGLAAELQVKQAEGALAQLQASVPVLEVGLEAAMNAMDVMLGSPAGTHRTQLLQVSAIPVAPKIGDAGSPAELLRRRPDLIIAERRLAASNARIGAAMAEYYPKISIGGFIGSATTGSASNLLGNDANQAAGVLGLRWRLFDFGRIESQIAQAKGQEAEMLVAYRLAALRATEEVENAFSSWIKREQQAVALSQGIESLTRARSASFAAYEKGIVSLIEVLQADENLLRASDVKAQAHMESSRAAVAAFRALGGGWLPPGSKVKTKEPTVADKS